MKKLPSLVYGLLLTTFCLPVFAQVKDLTINAQNISYDKENNIIDAEGSVEVIYKDTKITADHLVYYTDKERIFADKGFTLNYNQINLQGETIDYGIKSKKGNASQFHFTYKGILLSGGLIEINPEIFRLKNASFSTCDAKPQHYHVTALEIQLYPQYGWLVAYWGFFWLNNIPLVPVPTYIYDLFAEEKGRRNLPPFPEMGSNDEDGAYINEKLVWHLRRELSGTYTLSYAANKGLGGGIEGNYILSDINEGNVRLYGNAKDGLYGGITHIYSFGKEIRAEEKPFGFLVLPKYHQFQLETTLSSRERINYQRVSFYPNLILKLRQGELITKEIKTDAELLLSMVAEEGNIQLGRYGGYAKAYYDFPEMVFGSLAPVLSLDGLFYSNGGKWIKLSGELKLQKKITGSFASEIGYLQYFLTSGQSPFNFEIYRFNPSNRFTSKLSFVIGETGVGISTSHYLPTWQAEDIDYSLFFRLHCYNLIASYRSLRREFSLGASLVTR